MRMGGHLGAANRRGESEGRIEGVPRPGATPGDQTWGQTGGPNLGTTAGDKTWGPHLFYLFLSAFANFKKFTIEGSDFAGMHP